MFVGGCKMKTMLNKLKTFSLVLIDGDFVHNCAVFLTAVISFLFITPWFVRNANRFFLIGVCILWIVFVALDIRKKEFDYRALVFIVGYSYWVLISFVYYFLGLSTSAIGNYMVLLFVFIAFLTGIFIKDYCSLNEKKFLFILLIAFFLINCFDNIIISIRYPDAHAEFFTIYGQPYYGFNIAETPYYMGTVMALLFGVLSFKKAHLIIKIFLLAFFAVAVVFLFTVEPRATAVLLLIFSLLALLFFRIKLIYKIILILVLAAAILSIVLLYNNIVDWLTYLGKDNRLVNRVLAILKSFTGGSGTKDSFMERARLSVTSLRTWVSSPFAFFFGIGDKTDYSNLYLYGIGGHSEFFDNFAMYGLFNCLFLWVAMFYYFDFMIKCIKDDKYLYVIFFVAFLYCLLNHISRPSVIISLALGFGTADCFVKSTEKELKGANA